MTREDIECIIKWFSHIEQLATDGKTANGFQMPPDKILATIKVVAKDSREYVEKFCYESTPNDLEEAAREYFKPEWSGSLIDAFIAGAKWKAEKDARDMYMSDNRHFEKVYQLGKKDMKEQMMKDAVECKVFNYGLVQYPGIFTTLPDGEYNEGDKVRIIIVKEE